MKTILGIIIFCIVLFLYLHIQYHLKTSNDLEIYTIDNPTKEKLEEICDLRQPVTFEYNIDSDRLDKTHLATSYGPFDVNVKDANDNDNYMLPISFKICDDLFNKDDTARFYSENNSGFLNETGVVKILQQNDGFLRPSMVSNCHYDLLYGSNNTTTPFRYEMNYRTFFYVNSDYVTIKLAPPKYGKYLYTYKDYSNFEFKSPVNPWEIQSQYRNDFDKIKCLDIKLYKNSIIFIPAYWWYSIKFTNKSELIALKYRTYFNNVAISPHVILSLLQQQNTKNKVVKNLAQDNQVIKEEVSVDESDKNNNNKNEKLKVNLSKE